MMTETTCPHCGLVIAAAPERAAVWLAEHVARYHPPLQQPFPERARFTAIEDALTCLGWRTVYDRPLPYESPLAFTWAESISVQDAEWLHSLRIDPN